MRCVWNITELQVQNHAVKQLGYATTLTFCHFCHTGDARVVVILSEYGTDLMCVSHMAGTYYSCGMVTSKVTAWTNTDGSIIYPRSVKKKSSLIMSQGILSGAKAVSLIRGKSDAMLHSGYSTEGMPCFLGPVTYHHDSRCLDYCCGRMVVWTASHSRVIIKQQQ
jgi:hypothetical protein